jgi:hypothetical protein
MATKTYTVKQLLALSPSNRHRLDYETQQREKAFAKKPCLQRTPSTKRRNLSSEFEEVFIEKETNEPEALNPISNLIHVTPTTSNSTNPPLVPISEKEASTNVLLTRLLEEVTQMSKSMEMYRIDMCKVTKDLATMTDKVMSQEKVICALQAKVDALESRQAPSRHDAQRLDQLSARITREDELRRKRNLVVTGLEPFLPQGARFECCRTTATELINSRLALNVNIQSARRLGKPRSDGSAAPLLITLWEMEDKWTILRNCKKLAGTRIRVQEDLSLEVRMARRRFIGAYHINRRIGKRVRWEGDQLLVDGRTLTDTEISEAATEYFSGRRGAGIGGTSRMEMELENGN